MRLKHQRPIKARVSPRLHHWVLATIILLALMLVVPVVAGLT